MRNYVIRKYNEGFSITDGSKPLSIRPFGRDAVYRAQGLNLERLADAMADLYSMFSNEEGIDFTISQGAEKALPLVRLSATVNQAHRLAYDAQKRIEELSDSMLRAREILK